MTGVNIGMNLKYLPWQLFVPIVFGLSIICVYGAVIIKKKSKVVNIFFICIAIYGFLMGLETIAINTGILAEYLPFLKPIYYIFLGIAVLLMLWDS